MANKDEIRQIFREELSRQPSSKSINQSLYATTQGLIRGAVSSAAGSTEGDTKRQHQQNNLNPSPAFSHATPPIASHVPKSPWDRTPASSGNRKAQTGHLWRLKSIPSKHKTLTTKSVNRRNLMWLT